MKVKRIAVAAAFLSTIAIAAEAKVYRFDSDGGRCQRDSIYAEFGAEGMAYINAGGSRYIPEGNFFQAANPRVLKNGLVVFPAVDEYNHRFDFIINPATGSFTAEVGYAANPKVMEKEGAVDVAHMKPCK